jgi:hypothetical protein
MSSRLLSRWPANMRAPLPTRGTVENHSKYIVKRISMLGLSVKNVSLTPKI